MSYGFGCVKFKAKVHKFALAIQQVTSPVLQLPAEGLQAPSRHRAGATSAAAPCKAVATVEAAPAIPSAAGSQGLQPAPLQGGPPESGFGLLLQYLTAKNQGSGPEGGQRLQRQQQQDGTKQPVHRAHAAGLCVMEKENAGEKVNYGGFSSTLEKWGEPRRCCWLCS